MYRHRKKGVGCGSPSFCITDGSLEADSRCIPSAANEKRTLGMLLSGIEEQDSLPYDTKKLIDLEKRLETRQAE